MFRVALGNGVIQAMVLQWVNTLNRKRWRGLVTFSNGAQRKASKVPRYNKSTLSWITAMVTSHDTI